jgi:phenylacetate-CoA ligase
MISRLSLLKTSAKILNNPFLTHYELAKARRMLMKSELENLQADKLKKLLTHASRDIPFYQNRFVNHNLDGIQNLPLLSKQALKDAGNEAIKSNTKLIRKTTSGTTGPAFSFYIDKDFFAKELAQNLRIFDFSEFELGQPWVLLVPLRDKKNPFFSYLTNRLVLDAAMLSSGKTPLCCPKTIEERFQPDERIIQKFFNKIDRHKPKLIYSYPSTMIALATHLKNWNVRNVRTEKIILSGEILTYPARKFIEEIFQGEVFELYGTTEFPSIAQECKIHNGLHIFTDSYYVEFAPDNEIIVTDLENYTMPFIRYQTADYGFLKSEKCRCGCAFPLMDITQGRVSDLIVSPNGQFLRASFFTTLLEKNREIKKFQLVQETQNKLKIYLIADNLSASRQGYLARRIKEYTVDAIEISLEFMDNINMPLKKYFQTYPPLAV